jgi:hypothetical protein
MQFPRAAVLALFLITFFAPARSASAAVLSVCTEEELAFALETGGEWEMECISNLFSIHITRPLIASRDVTIRVLSTNHVILTGSNITRLLVIQPNVRAEFEGFAFFSGRQTSTNENSGGIVDTAGGAIYNDNGHLIVSRGRFQANSVVGVAGGAGEDGTGESGESGGDAAGGAIYNHLGTVTISNVVFESNVTTAGAGGKGGNAQASGLGGSAGNGGDGGSAAGSAIYNHDGTVHVSASTFTANSATAGAPAAGGTTSSLLGSPGRPGIAGDGVGGAIAGSQNSVLHIWGSTFANNSVRGANGLNGNSGVGRNDGDSGLTGGEAAGGAIYTAGRLSLTNSTFFRNTATSGNGGNGGAGSSDGFGFDGGDGGNGGLASGGAVDAGGMQTVIVHCTFSDNTVTGGSGGTGGAGSGLGESGSVGSKGAELGGALYGSGAEIIAANSIFANSRPTLGGNVKDLGGNITTDRSPLITQTNLSFSLASPSLLPLASNGGPTQTMGIRSNSIAINNGVELFCAALDQRGTNRVDCDIGAYEFVLPSLQVIFQTNAVYGTNRVVTLQWPVTANIVLQGATNLAGTNTVWVPVTNGVTQASGMNSFTVAPNLSLPFAFYRLFGSTTITPPSPAPPENPAPPAPTPEDQPVDSPPVDSEDDDIPVPPTPSVSGG